MPMVLMVGWMIWRTQREFFQLFVEQGSDDEGGRHQMRSKCRRASEMPKIPPPTRPKSRRMLLFASKMKMAWLCS